MDREQKAEVVKEITARLEESEAIFAIDYRGISVPQAAELRGALRDADASFSIVKNRLAKRAAEDAGRQGLDELLDGPTALTYVRGDIVTAAKAISNFNREHDVLAYKGGFMDGDAVDEDRFKSLARLPALDVMHGQLVGMTAAPLTGLVRGLGSMLSGLAVALGQIQEQGLVGEAESAGSDPSPEDTPEPAEAQGSDPTESESAEAESAESESAGSDPSPAETSEPAEAQGSDPTGSSENENDPEASETDNDEEGGDGADASEESSEEA